MNIGWAVFIAIAIVIAIIFVFICLFLFKLSESLDFIQTQNSCLEKNFNHAVRKKIAGQDIHYPRLTREQYELYCKAATPAYSEIDAWSDARTKLGVDYWSAVIKKEEAEKQLKEMESSF